jgi:hypothetical protein
VSTPYGTRSESETTDRAIRREGGEGGLGGTGQAFPHHGFDEDTRAAIAHPIGQEASLAAPGAGSTYQTGDNHLNRDHQEAVRKERSAGHAAANRRAGSDATPGAATKRA